MTLCKSRKGFLKMSAIITPKASCFGGAPNSQEGGWSYHREFAWPLQGFWTMVGWPNLMSNVWTMAHMVLAVHVLSWHGGLYVYHTRDTYDIVWLFLPVFTRPYSCGKYTLHSHWARILQKTTAMFFLQGWHQCPFIPDLNENLHQPNTCLLDSFQQTTIMWKTHQFPLGKISRIYEWIGSVWQIYWMPINYIFDIRFSKNRGSPGI
jgi:hypothetical protein